MNTVGELIEALSRFPKCARVGVIVDPELPTPRVSARLYYFWSKGALGVPLGDDGKPELGGRELYRVFSASEFADVVEDAIKSTESPIVDVEPRELELDKILGINLNDIRITLGGEL
jgi:hypothetical protein